LAAWGEEKNPLSAGISHLSGADADHRKVCPYKKPLLYSFIGWTIKSVNIEFDDAKSRRNAGERGLPFERAAEFEWETAIYEEDARKDYGERRTVAIGFLEERLHVLCFTPIGDGVRIISFRKANTREVKAYEQETADR
jgi:hypothetical protein